jgi:PTS system mannose-specific IIB component
MIWFRIDNRLVHGQVIEGWLPYLAARALVVANDDLALDRVRQDIMSLAIPASIAVRFVPVSGVKPLHDEFAALAAPALFLFAALPDAVRAVEQGVPIKVLNIGNMHYAKGKKHICTHVAVNEDDLANLDQLRHRGVLLDFRCVPGDVPLVDYPKEEGG